MKSLLLRLLFLATGLFAGVLPSGHPSNLLAEVDGTVQVLLLGDSTTIGSVCRVTNPEGPHLEDVVRLLLATEKDLPAVNVINQGRDGEFIHGLLTNGRYDKDIAKLPGIDYIFIRYGLNDNSRREDFATNFPADFKELIGRLRRDFPEAVILPTTIIPYISAEADARINGLIRQVAADEKLTLFDVYTRYQNELAAGSNMLNYRRYPLEKIPEQHREWVAPFVRGTSVVVMDNRLDAHFGNLPGWYSDRHPNLAGYHVIGDETARFLAPLIRNRRAATADAGTTPERPNVVVVLCDDLGFGDLGVHGHPHIKTPNIDRLASEGIRFTNFYSAAPVCSPSRVGLMTGRSPNRAGVYDWIPPADAARPLQRKDGRELVHMRREETTVAQLLKKAGYATCMAGKWHCNSMFNQDAQPQPGDAGFDHWLATQNNAAPSHENPENYVRNGKPAGPMTGFSCQIAVSEAIEWLDSHVATSASQPFFVYLPFHEPHEPVASPPELVALYQSVAQNADQAQYFANVHNVDLAVGRIVEALEKLKVRDNTLIVFTADNGPETLNRYRTASRSWGITAHLRGMKLHTHDGGFHVAGIMNWPKVIRPGQTIDDPVSSLDLLPTLSELAGQPLPTDRPLDGISLAGLLRGGPMPVRSQPLVWAYYNAINDARVAMRHGPWKVLARLGAGIPRFENLTAETLQTVRQAELTEFEIYNVERDPGETQNLSGRQLSEQAELTALLKDRYRELAASSPAWEAPVSDR